MKLDKLMKYMKINEDDEEFDDEYLDDEDDDEVYAAPPRKTAPARPVREEAEYEERPARKVVQPKVTPIRQASQKRNAPGGMEVCMIKPTSFDQAREITETLLSNRTVVLNLEGVDMDVAQRIVDFASGSTFAINGNLQKISHSIFIITPSTVDVYGDFPEILNGSMLDMSLNNNL